MKQILQNLSSGETQLADVPAPKVQPGHLLIETEASLVSLGTERSLIEFGKANWIEKARQQPDKVKQVLKKIKTDGFMPTLDVVRSKLDTPLPLGYCNVGRVLELGAGVEGFQVGERVLSNSAHAEVVCAPKNLCAKVPKGLAPEVAVYGVVGAIGLHGIRLLKPTLGETFVVMGLGLIGQLAVQILLASGCRVIGVDIDSAKCALAQSFGAEVVDLSKGLEPVQVAEALTNEKGVDGVLITASTSSDEPIHHAASMCRKKGRIVLVGVVGMKMDRSIFYEKEISFQVSCSYGPGRNDPCYEKGGNDYPLAYVRWTEQRNFEVLISLLQSGKIQTEPLTTSCYNIDSALDAYRQTDANVMGVVLRYEQSGKGSTSAKEKRVIKIIPRNEKVAKTVVGIIGAGSFTDRVLAPDLKKRAVWLKAISSATGVSSAHLARKFGIENAVTDNEAIFSDSDINTVFITTRHANHGSLVLRALKAGKSVFVEKPLCIEPQELSEIEAFYANNPHGPRLMVGFNRRFSPLVRQMKTLLAARAAPVAMVYNVNAGMIPMDHWSQSKAEGGGRIVGEACHFIDTLRFLAGSAIKQVDAYYARPDGVVIGDLASIHLSFHDGSIGTVHYFGNGNKDMFREGLDLYCGGGILRMQNFKSLAGFGWPGFKKTKLRRQDKGHAQEITEFLNAMKTGADTPLPLEEIFEVTAASFAANDAQ